jgi:TolB-like protein
MQRLPSAVSRKLRAAGLSGLTALVVSTGLSAPALALPGYQLQDSELVLAQNPTPTETPQPAERVRVAIVDFKAIGAPADFGEAVAENLRNSLVQHKQFKVVERAQIDKALKEQSFGQSGLVDAKQAVTLGKLVGAKIIVVGSVTKIGTTYTVNARFIDVETGEATDARSIKTNHEDDIAQVVDELAAELSGKSGTSTFPAAANGQAQPPRMVKTGKSKALALTMSLLIPGTGQFYAGNAGSGALQFGFGLAGLGVASYGKYESSSLMLGSGLLLMIIASTWSALDGFYSTAEEELAK